MLPYTIIKRHNNSQFHFYNLTICNSTKWIYPYGKYPFANEETVCQSLHVQSPHHAAGKMPSV